mgnify:FL=1
MVNEWRNRPLQDINFPYIVTDVVYIKSSCLKNFYNAIRINNGGYREMIGFMFRDGEIESSW